MSNLSSVSLSAVSSASVSSNKSVRPWDEIEIAECGESLINIDRIDVHLSDPHPYVRQGAGDSYCGMNPWRLRSSVSLALADAARRLKQRSTGLRLGIYDAWRPLAVQKFMVELTFAQVCERMGVSRYNVFPQQYAEIETQVYALWAPPDERASHPPPHSTGSAIDLTLIDENGLRIDMGSLIDEANNAHPDALANAVDDKMRRAHDSRMLLRDVMIESGFHQHPAEWWHFSLGDKMWAWQERQKKNISDVIAIYGRCE